VADEARTEAQRVAAAIEALDSPNLIEPSCDECYNVCYPTEPCTCPGCWPAQVFAAGSPVEPVSKESPDSLDLGLAASGNTDAAAWHEDAVGWVDHQADIRFREIQQERQATRGQRLRTFGHAVLRVLRLGKKP